MLLHYTLLGLFLFLCFLLIIAILLQAGKGGGLAGLGGGSTNSAFGVHTTNVLQKFTGWCVLIFFVTVIVLAKTQPGSELRDTSHAASQIEEEQAAEKKKEAETKEAEKTNPVTNPPGTTTPAPQ